MMNTLSKVYAVIEYGGEWEDSWEHILGVCSTSELADSLKNRIEESRHKEIKITADEFDRLYDKLAEYEAETGQYFESVSDGIISLSPEYDAKDIEEALQKYYFPDDYVGVRIEEINFFNNLSDISK